MTHDLRHRLIVGVDGSSCSELALRWAVDEADRRSLPLHLVHARSVGDWWRFARVGVPSELLTAADPILQERVDRIRSRSSHLLLTAESFVAHAAEVLVTSSRGAAGVVLGSRGRGPVGQTMLGSVSAHVSAHAHCPVVVVHDAAETVPREARVVVGVDGSGGSDAAISYAFEQAAARSIGLTAVHSWTAALGDDWTAAGHSFHQRQDMMRAYRNRLFETVAARSLTYPDVEVQDCIRLQDPVTTLVEESRRAALVVVGSRGLGGFAGLLMGSVSRAVLARAACPVAVVRPG